MGGRSEFVHASRGGPAPELASGQANSSSRVPRTATLPRTHARTPPPAVQPRESEPRAVQVLVSVFYATTCPCRQPSARVQRRQRTRSDFCPRASLLSALSLRGRTAAESHGGMARSLTCAIAAAGHAPPRLPAPPASPRPARRSSLGAAPRISAPLTVCAHGVCRLSGAFVWQRRRVWDAGYAQGGLQAPQRPRGGHVQEH